MQSTPVRVALVMILLVLVVIVPFIFSGYSELKQVPASTSYTEMAEHYWRAARRIPWRPDAYELAGHAYYHAEKYAKADAAYEKAFRRNALSNDGWVAWGDVQYLRNDPIRATQIWEQALGQPHPSEKLYSRLSQTYQENGDYARAAEYLGKYVALHQEDASARYRLGLLLSLTDVDRALSELINASELDPQLDPAVETLRSALNLASLSESPSEQYVLIGRGLGLVHEWELAQAAFESAVTADAENAEAWAWLGESKQQSGGDGLADLDRALSLDPDSATVRGLRGLYFQRTGNFREALTEFQFAAQHDEKNPAWLVSIGETYSKLGDLIRAMQSYQAATELAPENVEYWRMLALFCAQNNVNISDVGIPAARKAVELRAEDAMALDLLGWLLLLNTQYDEAEQTLLLALKADPQYALAHFHLGMLYLEQNERASAFAHFVNARDLGNGDAQIILNQYFP